MARKVLIISSSPRRGGNSDLLCDRFMEGAREAGLEVEKVFLKDLKINYCTGCNRCYNGEHPCPQRDDAAGVLEKMVAADVIVMATPVYFYTVCGQMKTLIDRCCARYTEMTDKEFYFILTAAEESIPMMGWSVSADSSTVSKDPWSVAWSTASGPGTSGRSNPRPRCRRRTNWACGRENAV